MKLLTLNRALFERLRHCEEYPVFDSVPENRKMPYIVLAETNAQPCNTKTTVGLIVTAGILLYSDYKGDKEINHVADLIVKLLETETFDLGETWVVIRQELNECKVERLEEYREGSIKLQLKIYKR